MKIYIFVNQESSLCEYQLVESIRHESDFFFIIQERDRDRETERQRQRQRQTETEIDREKERGSQRDIYVKRER